MRQIFSNWKKRVNHYTIRRWCHKNVSMRSQQSALIQSFYCKEINLENFYIRTWNESYFYFLSFSHITIYNVRKETSMIDVTLFFHNLICFFQIQDMNYGWVCVNLYFRTRFTQLLLQQLLLYCLLVDTGAKVVFWLNVN